MNDDGHHRPWGDTWRKMYILERAETRAVRKSSKKLCLNNSWVHKRQDRECGILFFTLLSHLKTWWLGSDCEKNPLTPCYKPTTLWFGTPLLHHVTRYYTLVTPPYVLLHPCYSLLYPRYTLPLFLEQSVLFQGLPHSIHESGLTIRG